MKVYIGVDLGGTNVRVAKIDEQGSIIKMEKEPSEVQRGYEYTFHNIISMIERVMDEDTLHSIGIGVPGPVNTKTKQICISENLVGFENKPITKLLENYFHVPVAIDNDVNCAGLAEAIHGAGKGKDSVYYISISTGVGGAFIVQGKTIAGEHGFAGELCKVCIDAHPQRKHKQQITPLNNCISGTSFTNKAQDVLKVETTQDVFDLAKQNNVDALQLIDDLAFDIALLLNNISYIVNPGVFVLGGGLMKSSDLFLDKVNTYYQSMLFEGMKDVEIKEAALEEPGIVGASLLLK